MRLEDYRPSAFCEVECVSRNGQSTLVFVRHFSHSQEKVWSAITESKKIAAWAPFAPDRDLVSLGPVILKMNDGSEPEDYPSNVLQVVVGELLEYSWGSEHKLRWEIEKAGAGTKLILLHTVDDAKWITPSAAGWHMCLDFTEILLDGYDFGPVLAEAAMEYGWQELAEHYGKVLGMPLDNTDDSDGGLRSGDEE